MSYIRSVLLVKPYVVVLASGTILATAFGLIAVKLFTNYKQWVNNNKSKKFKSKHKYPKYTVILHQYRRGLRAPSLSPCALKLETFLRMTNVTYQVCFMPIIHFLGLFYFIFFFKIKLERLWKLFVYFV